MNKERYLIRFSMKAEGDEKKALYKWFDLLDSKMYEMDAALDGVATDGFSERLWALDNRQLYKID